MIAKVRMATPRSVGTIRRSRPMMYRCTRRHHRPAPAFWLVRYGYSLAVRREPDARHIHRRVVIRSDAVPADYREMRNDPVPPDDRDHPGLLAHGVTLDLPDQLLALLGVGLLGLGVDHAVELGVVVVREVQVLAEPAGRAELRQLQVWLVEVVAVEVEAHVEVLV